MRKLIAGGLTGALGMLLFASSALAASHNPTGEYAPFAECPMNRATINDCVYSTTTGGSVTLGKKTVPIKKNLLLPCSCHSIMTAFSFFPFFLVRFSPATCLEVLGTGG